MRDWEPARAGSRIDWILWLKRRYPSGQHVGDIVHCSEANRIASEVHKSDAECSPSGRINGKLGDELPCRRELHDFTRLIWIHVRTVAISHDQIAVGSQDQIEGSMQVSQVLVNHRAGSGIVLD